METSTKSSSQVTISTHKFCSSNCLMDLDSIKLRLIGATISCYQAILVCCFIGSFLFHNVSIPNQADNTLICTMGCPLFVTSLYKNLEDLDTSVLDTFGQKLGIGNQHEFRKLKFIKMDSVGKMIFILHATFLTISYLASILSTLIFILFSQNFFDFILNSMAIIFVMEIDSLFIKFIKFDVEVDRNSFWLEDNVHKVDFINKVVNKIWWLAAAPIAIRLWFVFGY